MNYEELPKSMQEDAIRPYWELLQKSVSPCFSSAFWT